MQIISLISFNISEKSHKNMSKRPKNPFSSEWVFNIEIMGLQYSRGDGNCGNVRVGTCTLSGAVITPNTGGLKQQRTRTKPVSAVWKEEWHNDKSTPRPSLMLMLPGSFVNQRLRTKNDSSIFHTKLTLPPPPPPMHFSNLPLPLGLH